MTNKYIIIDFEFDGVDIHNAELNEFCALFVKDDIIIDELALNVKYEYEYSGLSESKKNGLNFIGKGSQEKLDEHNNNAIDEKEVINLFLQKLKKNFGEDKVPIMGWNHASDMTILYKIFNRHNINFNDVLDYHILDVGSMFRAFYDKEYSNKFGFHLGEVHQNLIGTFKKEDFHIAKTDCLATLDIYKWIKEQIK